MSYVDRSISAVGAQASHEFRVFIAVSSTKAGHTGDIINAIFYQVRAKPGIKIEWVWVKESESEVESTPTEVTATVYQIKITILGTQPPVWRRIQVLDRTSAILTRLSRPSWAGNTATCISLSSTTNTTVNRI